MIHDKPRNNYEDSQNSKKMTNCNLEKYEEEHETTSGNHVQLHVCKFQNGLEIVVKNEWEMGFWRKFSFLTFLVILLIIALYYQLMSPITCLLLEFVLVVLLIHTFLYSVCEEKLLVIRNIGYQIQTKYTVGETLEFITWQKIEDVFINEVISMQRVLFILTILTTDSDKKLVPLFVKTKPRLKCLQTVYRLLKRL